jgi:hypothetical protein
VSHSSAPAAGEPVAAETVHVTAAERRFRRVRKMLEAQSFERPVATYACGYSHSRHEVVSAETSTSFVGEKNAVPFV